MKQHEVHHDLDVGMFYIGFDDNQKAFLRYRLVESKEGGKGVDFHTTFVPNDHRRKGIAEKLANRGIAWANQNQLTIEASCWYVAKILANTKS